VPGDVDGVLVAAAAESHVGDRARDVVLIGVAGAQLDPGRPDHQQRGRLADGQQPATATMPAAMRPVIMKSLLRRGVCFMSGRLL
jgi:hypothetical protein